MEEVAKKRPLSSCQETTQAISASQVLFSLLLAHVATAESISVASLSLLLMPVTGALSDNLSSRLHHFFLWDILKTHDFQDFHLHIHRYFMGFFWNECKQVDWRLLMFV